MNVILYTTNDKSNVVNKTLTNELLFENVHLLDDIDIINPSIRLGGLTDVNEFINYNYMYIPKFSRYYFITNIRFVNKFCVIDSSVDVLYTYRSLIKNSTQLVTRQENNYNKFLFDNKLMMNNRNNYDCLSFGKGFNTDNNDFVLQVAGKP